jgi:GMP synthase-like glutamine amidotransferase
MKPKDTMKEYVRAALQPQEATPGACVGEERMVAFYSGQLTGGRFFK